MRNALKDDSASVARVWRYRNLIITIITIITNDKSDNIKSIEGIQKKNIRTEAASRGNRGRCQHVECLVPHACAVLAVDRCLSLCLSVLCVTFVHCIKTARHRLVPFSAW